MNVAKAEKMSKIVYGESLSTVRMDNQQRSSFKLENVQRLSKTQRELEVSRVRPQAMAVQVRGSVDKVYPGKPAKRSRK